MKIFIFITISLLSTNLNAQKREIYVEYKDVTRKPLELPSPDYNLIANLIQKKQAHYDYNLKKIESMIDYCLNTTIELSDEQIKKGHINSSDAEYQEFTKILSNSMVELFKIKNKNNDLTLYDNAISTIESDINNAFYNYKRAISQRKSLEESQTSSKYIINIEEMYGKWKIDKDVLTVSKVGTFKWFIADEKEELSGTWEIINNILILDIGQNRKLSYEILKIVDKSIQLRKKQSNGASISTILVGYKMI